MKRRCWPGATFLEEEGRRLGPEGGAEVLARSDQLVERSDI